MSINKRRRTAGDLPFQIICYVIFGVLALICIFPLYYIFVVSVSGNDLVKRGIMLLYPRNIHFSNYANAFKLQGFGRAAFVSVARTILGTTLTVGSCSFLGFAFSRKEFWKRSFFYRYLIITMYFSPGLIPVYMNLYNLGLTDTFSVYVIGFVSAYYVVLCKTFIESLPESLVESARIDGAGYLVTFTKIIFPLAKPITATIAVFTAVGHWNSYMDTLLYVRNVNLRTLQYVLYQYLSSATAISNAMSMGAHLTGVDLSKIVTPTSVKTTVTMIVTIPILFIYPIFQRFFVKGLMLGAVKG